MVCEREAGRAKGGWTAHRVPSRTRPVHVRAMMGSAATSKRGQAILSRWRWMRSKAGSCSASTRVSAAPRALLRPVRPIRCTYSRTLSGTSKFTTASTPRKSMPRATPNSSDPMGLDDLGANFTCFPFPFLTLAFPSLSSASSVSSSEPRLTAPSAADCVAAFAPGAPASSLDDTSAGSAVASLSAATAASSSAGFSVECHET